MRRLQKLRPLSQLPASDLWREEHFLGYSQASLWLIVEQLSCCKAYLALLVIEGVHIH